MSLAEIQQEVRSLSDEERDILSGWLNLLARMKTPEFQNEMNEAMRRVDDGQCATEEEVRALHERLVAEGR